MRPTLSLKRSSYAAGLDDEPVLNTLRHSLSSPSHRTNNSSSTSEVAIDSPASTQNFSTVPASVSRDLSYTRDASSPSFELCERRDSQPTPDTSHTSTSLQSRQPAIEVCFGMLIGVWAAPLRRSTLKEKLTEHRKPEDSWAVAFRSDTAILLDESLAEVGQLDERHSSILSDLKKRVPSLKCEVFLISSETSISDQRSLREAFEAVVNLYGCCTFKDEVGTKLDEAKVYLQEPIHLKPEALYSNPHVFTVTDNGMTPIFGNQYEEERNDFASNIAKILNQSITFEDVSSFEQDGRILSTLNKHQVIAVKFALSREGDSLLTNTPTLWRPFRNSLGLHYRHCLTKVLSSHPPNECRGGLLADEMGMGKSLSMLSLIIHTLHEAREFVQTSQALKPRESQLPTKATLIITPKSTIDSWMKEIRRHMRPEGVRVVLYHGSEKNKHTTKLADVEIVLTTYETAVKSWVSPENLLGGFSWFRIILDEAQHIRNASTQAFSANGLNDIFALTKFLRFEPFVARKDIRTYISGPLSRRDEQGLTNLRSMMKVFSIRRMKSELELPPLKSYSISVTLSDSERDQYDRVKKDLLLELSEAIKRGKGGTSTTTLMGIRRLRQICCQGLTMSTTELRKSSNSTSEAVKCDKCKTTITGSLSSVMTQGTCGHTFCNACLAADIQTREGALDGVWICPACEQFGDASLADDRDQKLDVVAGNENDNADILAASRATSKMKAVLGALVKLHGNQANSSDPPVKSLVFSYWIRALDTIESGLLQQQQNMQYVRIDGQTPLAQRHEAITRFQTDPLCTVALLTLGTGSVGLNLTAASHVHLVEPHWNPMVEEQAAARAHRIGQTREVTVYRYIVEDSIEERIRNMQHQKFHLAHLAGVAGEGDEGYGGKKYDVSARTGKDVDGLEGVFEKWQLF